MLGKRIKKKLGIIKKTEILLRLVQDDQPLDDIYQQLTAPQMQDLRNYLEQQIVHFSALRDEEPLTVAAIKAKLEPVPNYYHNQYCREPLEACINETCMASNPSCFSNKMKTQLKVTLAILRTYLTPVEKETPQPGL